MQDPIYPTFTDDGKAPVVFDWPIATANSSDTFSNVNYALIQSQMAQFFPNTAPPGVFEGITDSNTYAIGVFYKVRVISCYLYLHAQLRESACGCAQTGQGGSVSAVIAELVLSLAVSCLKKQVCRL